VVGVSEGKDGCRKKLRDAGIHERIIKSILRKQGYACVWTGAVWLRIGINGKFFRTQQ
jgi:hypothetical protein